MALSREPFSEGVRRNGRKIMKTLYVSDLDGTLLRSNGMTSGYTNRIIRSLVERGMLFSYATARSLMTARKVTEGIRAELPVIVYNGAFIMDHMTGKILDANYFDETVTDVLDDLSALRIDPIVYARIDGKEKFSFVPALCTFGMKKFLDSRRDDGRRNAVKTPGDLKRGDIFYITCIDSPDKLEPVYDRYRNTFRCVYQKDFYTGEQWLEIMPQAASKSNAAKRLQQMMQCDRLVVFGDGRNDIDMFAAADGAYAVRNADEELKNHATAVISSNDEDAVARWLEQNGI